MRSDRGPILLCLLLALPAAAAATPDGQRTAGPGDRPQLTLFRDFQRDGRPCPFCPEMATVPAGRFFMGSLPGEGHNDEHGPEGRPLAVDIPAGLAFSVGEITRAEFAAYWTARGRHAPARGCSGLVEGVFSVRAGDGWEHPGFTQAGDHPVVCVSWETAADYAAWLSELTGQRYRLPTEAEWEYAALARSTYRYWWGDAMLPDRVNCRHEWCDTRYPHTAPSRAFRSNPFGLHDMLGNVWEWTADCYDAQAYRRHGAYPAPVTGAATCNRVIRGGSWTENYWSLRGANREGWKPDTPLNDIGFRVVRVGRHLPL